MIGWILLVLGGGLALWGIGIYNNLVTLKNTLKTSWGQIDVQLQRRYDLIPNLVETVKGYMAHEKGTLEGVVEARSQAMAAREAIKKEGGPTEGTIKKLLSAEGLLQGSLANIFALSESYPDLKASTTMQQLQDSLTNTENKISSAREVYNHDVRRYNTAQEVFPANLIARQFGHHQAELFDVEEPEARKPVEVKF
ncbi:MAG: LemA family protein [Waddliaceae bacterium]